MNNLLTISHLQPVEINRLVERALQFKHTLDYPAYPAHSMATLFYENSTRTRISFELAAKHLGLSVVNFELNTSSESKGEVIEDTFQTLKAMGIQLFVIRHSNNGLPASLAEKYGEHDVHIINAGDGQHAHPSQALLDFMTIVEK